MDDLYKISQKWQKKWKESDIFKVHENSDKPKYYCLEMFPYPSGYMHMGHVRNYSLGDVTSRYKRMKGFNVLYPMGFDSFGLPAENAAIKHGANPKEWTMNNIKGIKEQLLMMGFSYDWSREVITCKPEYYKWNQKIFIEFFENKIAYKKEAPVNWCNDCNTVLANEQVVEGRCWRCDSEVMQKNLSQWFFNTKKYADELLDEIENLKGWPEKVKVMQKNWIGRSKGIEITFNIKDTGVNISTFTTRPDTIFGVTYLVLAPEHPLVEKLTKGTEYEKPAKDFLKLMNSMSEFERVSSKEKNGLFIGKYFINPVNGKECPIYIADYALMNYGTGAVMAVPTHDQRDFEFAKKYDLPMIVVIQPEGQELKAEEMTEAYVDPGFLVNSGSFDGINNLEAIENIADFLEKKQCGKKTINYRLKDWLISRQRYWGTPIPIVHCEECGLVTVKEEDLPVLLPEDVEFKGTGNPIETSESFVNTTCPKCGGKARRETDTMDTFVDSSWYFLRYCSPKAGDIFNKDAVDYWMTVDKYIGGIEHATMHLLYARFFTKALRDLGYVKFSEPFNNLFTLGMVTKDGTKMSKSVGNVVDPVEYIEKFGPDTVRLFILHAALPEKELEWSDQGVAASHKFLMKVHSLLERKDKKEVSQSKISYIKSKLHSTIKDVTQEIEDFRFNFAINHMMSFVNDFIDYRKYLDDDTYEECVDNLILLLTPFAPHLCEEMWELREKTTFVSLEPWPRYCEEYIDEKIEFTEEMMHDVSADIVSVLQLAKLEKPTKISLFVSLDWKYEIVRKIKEKMKNTFNVSEIIQYVMEPQFGKEISKMIPMFVKNPSKLPKVVMTQEEEFEVLEDNKNLLEERFRCKVEVVKAEDSQEKKASQALPGKPAILAQ